MVDSLIGSYKFEKNENFESFLSATGVPFIPRKMMVMVSPSVNISKDGDVWTVTFNVLLESFSIQFELGKTFVEENPVSKEINKVRPRSCKRSKTLFQKSLLLFLTRREYFYSQPTHFSSQPKK